MAKDAIESVREAKKSQTIVQKSRHLKTPSGSRSPLLSRRPTEFFRGKGRGRAD